MIHFIIKSGELYYLPEVPEYPENKAVDYTSTGIMKRAQQLGKYESALEEAMKKAVRVKNLDDDFVSFLIPTKPLGKNGNTPDTIYSLDDSYRVEVTEEPVKTETLNRNCSDYEIIKSKLAIVSKV